MLISVWFVCGGGYVVIYIDVIEVCSVVCELIVVKIVVEKVEVWVWDVLIKECVCRIEVKLLG